VWVCLHERDSEIVCLRETAREEREKEREGNEAEGFVMIVGARSVDMD